MKKKKGRVSLHHGAVERELRRLHDMGASVERQRDLLRVLLRAIVRKHGWTIDLTKADLDAAKDGKLEVEAGSFPGGMRVRFVVPPFKGVEVKVDPDLPAGTAELRSGDKAVRIENLEVADE